MRYAAGVDSSLDRPGHIRAGSGLAWVGDRLAVVQDDANFIALVDPTTGLADSIVLPSIPFPLASRRTQRVLAGSQHGNALGSRGHHDSRDGTWDH